MARLKTVEGLLVDRFHRGAILMVGTMTFAVSEDVVRLVEAVRDGGGAYTTNAGEQATVDALVARGVVAMAAEER